MIWYDGEDGEKSDKPQIGPWDLDGGLLPPMMYCQWCGAAKSGCMSIVQRLRRLFDALRAN